MRNQWSTVVDERRDNHVPYAQVDARINGCDYAMRWYADTAQEAEAWMKNFLSMYPTPVPVPGMEWGPVLQMPFKNMAVNRYKDLNL